jgi:hypothetical protein
MTTAPEPADLLIRDARLLVTMAGDEIEGGWGAGLTRRRRRTTLLRPSTEQKWNAAAAARSSPHLRPES